MQYRGRLLAGIFQTSLVVAVIAFGVYFDHASSNVAPVAQAAAALTADLARERASAEVREVALWAVDSHDHAGLPFVVVDKARARLFAFDQDGRLRGSTSVLLSEGAAIPPTPTGRFVADGIRSAQVDGIVWEHDGATVSLHCLPDALTSASSPGGVQRLPSSDPQISDGSLHVSGDFYRDYLSPLKSQVSIAYVLGAAPVQNVSRANERQQPTDIAAAQSQRGNTTRKPS